MNTYRPKTAETYYDVLGITREASAGEIKAAYRRLAKQYHPDINTAPGAQERFLKVQEAYDTLSDPEKRAEYDRLLAAGTAYSPYGTPPGGASAAYRQAKARTYYYHYSPGGGFSSSERPGEATPISRTSLALILLGGILMIVVLVFRVLLGILFAGNRKNER